MAFNVNNRDGAIRAFGFFTAREIKRALEGAGSPEINPRSIRRIFESQSTDSLKEVLADEIEKQARKLFP